MRWNCRVSETNQRTSSLARLTGEIQLLRFLEAGLAEFREAVNGQRRLSIRQAVAPTSCLFADGEDPTLGPPVASPLTL